MDFDFISILKTSAKKHIKRNAFCIKGKYYSYKDFFTKVGCIAQELKKEDSSHKSIALIPNNDLETYATIIAIWLSGNTYVPISKELPRSRLSYISDRVKFDVIVSSSPVKSNHLKADKFINTKKIAEPCKDMDASPLSEKSTAYIVFTSGSTGNPKGVPVSYKNLNAFVDSFLAQNYTINEEDSFLQMADLSFDMSIISLLIPLCIGACVYTINDDGVKYLETYKALSEYDITVLVTAPSTLQLLKPFYSEISLKKLKYTFVGAEAFYESTAKSWKKCAPKSQIVNLYGPTESGIVTTAYSLKKRKIISFNDIVSIGQPVKNINCFIVDEGGSVAKQGETGELWISGSQVFDSYILEEDNIDAWGELLINGKEERCYKTGDMVFSDKEGNLFFKGRKDRQVKIQGQRIEPAEIEHCAAQMQGNFHPVVLAYTDDFFINKLALFVDDGIDLIKLKKLMQEQLPDCMIPSRIIPLKSLPLNKNQKINYNLLKRYIASINI